MPLLPLNPTSEAPNVALKVCFSALPSRSLMSSTELNAPARSAGKAP